MSRDQPHAPDFPAGTPRSTLAVPARPTPLSPEVLQQRRGELVRGLRRSHYAVVAASLVVGLCALVALWLSGEARHSTEDAVRAQQRATRLAGEVAQASTNLTELDLRSARVQRSLRSVGQRVRALEFVADAARRQPTRELRNELRNEALSSLLLPDMGTNLVWREEPGFEVAMAYDAGFEHFIMNNDRQRAIVRLATNGTLLMDERGFGKGTPFWQFSPDGRLAAIAFFGGQIGVWNWRQKKLVARFPTIDAGWGEPPFGFSQDGQRLWVLDPKESLIEYAIETGQQQNSIPLGRSARFVRLSPSGKFAALSCGNELAIWDLASCTQRATLTLTNEIWRVAWQPGEERLAIGCYGGLFLWDLGAVEAVTLRKEGAITVVFFNADGDLLFTSGWNVAGEVWNIRSRRTVLEFADISPLELSRDQTRLSVSHGRVGYGINQYLPPMGLRAWPAPPALGEERRGADLDPQDRWVLTGHPHGWLLRDANSGKELVRAKCDLAGDISFSSDGTNVLAWTRSGLTRWPLEPRGDGLATVEAKPVLTLPQNSQGGSFSADRRFTFYVCDGVVTVVNIDDNARRVSINLQHKSDSSLYLSPNGHWLVTGLHNREGFDLYDTKEGPEGMFVRRFAKQDHATPVFDPNSGACYICTATNYTKWDLETCTPASSVPWRVPFAYQGFVGFAQNGQAALVKSNPTSLALFDLQTGRDFATMDFRDGLPVFKSAFTRDGQRLFLFSNDGGVTRVDLAPLRHELHALGLDWSDAEPSRESHALEAGMLASSSLPDSGGFGIAQTKAMRHPTLLAWTIWAGLAASILIGLYFLRYQRRLFGGYLESEALAARREGELQLTQTALLHSEKMKALGTLSAGIAHDFNNLLSVIRLSNELIEEEVQPQGVTKDNFEAIRQAIQRGRGIVNSMLGYARDDGQPREFKADELLGEAVALLGKSFLGGLTLQVNIHPHTPPIFARKGHVEQMLFNLLVNAAEAMRGQGTLTLSARPVREPGNCLSPPAEAPGFVELGVQDSGPGIPPNVLPRIFEPFFTTKTLGAKRGTGLGLSMLYTMAKQDGVGVDVVTEPGKGTTFHLLLPMPSPNAAEKAVTASGHHLPIAPHPQTGNPES